MSLDSSFCEFIRKIQQDPMAKISGLTVGDYYSLQEHLRDCQECDQIVSEILEKYKYHPGDPDSEWEWTKYN